MCARGIFSTSEMSNHASVRSRLNRFRQVLEKGRGHAGAKRFRKVWAGGTPYSRLESRTDFFVAWALVPCETTKKRRTPKDLRKMGSLPRSRCTLLRGCCTRQAENLN